MEYIFIANDVFAIQTLVYLCVSILRSTYILMVLPIAVAIAVCREIDSTTSGVSKEEFRVCVESFCIYFSQCYIWESAAAAEYFEFLFNHFHVYFI